MGQKVNPIIFRLNKTNSWKFKYFEKKNSESKTYNFKNIEIKKFIFRFFDSYGLNVHDLKLSYYNNKLHILISYFPTLKTISLISNANKIQKIKLVTKKPYINKYLDYEKIKKNVKKHIKYKKLNNAYQNRKLNFRRIRLIKYYKHYLVIKQQKQINNIQLNSFLNHFFLSLSLFYNIRINISLTLNKLNSNIKNQIQQKKLKIIKKNLIKLRRYENNEFFNTGINILFLCISKKNSAMLLANFIANQLKTLKRHNFFLRFIKNALTLLTNKTFSKLQGIKIKIKGRFNKAPRARHKIIQIGNSVPALTLKSKIDYFETISFSSNGTFGVKVWICEKH
jgi:hypothetical protein